eukprot:CAMPEP_0194344470 /NCGR_PEP_ID=MMETSP0171-20130528/101574_1 /TAXON_ID=218684 /ORGANISM="Corethron pennatum, Strain L29A3" /LENGTH=101 /DNA_ID=CAMNT_0039111149 /DNA_START=83 /DNA_END=385 /DNA_ORIENTATION=+
MNVIQANVEENGGTAAGLALTTTQLKRRRKRLNRERRKLKQQKWEALQLQKKQPSLGIEPTTTPPTEGGGSGGSAAPPAAPRTDGDGHDRTGPPRGAAEAT